jgi:hypothetical protein
MRRAALRACCLAAAIASLTSSLERGASAQQPFPSAQAGATIIGQVTDTLGSPLPHCLVRLEDAASAVLCDSAGTFRLSGLSHAATTFEVRRLGYTPGRFTVVVPGDSMRVTVQLVEMPALLAPISITAPGHSPWLESHGFYDRLRANISGTFITPEEFQALRVQRVTQALAGRPAVKIIASGPVAVPWDVTGRCLLNVFVDGLEINLYDVASGTRRGGVSFMGAWGKISPGGEGPSASSLKRSLGIDGFIQPSMVQAIEIYPSGPQTPIEFRASNECGAIVIWTKVGSRPAAPAAPDSSPTSSAPR